ncbi:4483_t:CDS:2 [Acaulospora morrowiae]|uniref:4483_t:CDS:1 n=1 Tax=Acaulospora morrowiae TaxID=94023 RepID=A0A9N8V685_9GLOM|nr:4483_t:CDS:2 [Acaulospora morrowiae]
MPKDKSSFKSSNKSINPYTVNKILIQEVKTLQGQNKNLFDTINSLSNTLTQLSNLVSKVIIPAVASYTAVLQYHRFYDKDYYIITEFKSSLGPEVSELPSFFDEFDQDILAIANEISIQ